MAGGGANQREVDINNAFHEAIEKVIKLKPHIVIIAGDLFHHVRPSNAVVTFCFRELRRLAMAVSRIVIIGGNHETPKRSDTGCVLRLFSEITGVHVADTNIEQFNFPEISTNVCCLPHAALFDKTDLRLRADDRCKFNILTVHAQVDETWMSDFGGVELDLKKLSPHEWDYIALGHVHLYRGVALNAFYAGSIEHTASNIWAEAGQSKGFLEIELPSLARKFHTLTSPREVIVAETLDARMLTPQEASEQINQKLLKIPGGVDGKIVRLEILNIPREVVRLLDYKGIKRWKNLALNLTLEFKGPDRQDSRQAFSSTARGTLEEQLDQYTKTYTSERHHSDEFTALFKSYFQKLEIKEELR